MEAAAGEQGCSTQPVWNATKKGRNDVGKRRISAREVVVGYTLGYSTLRAACAASRKRFTFGVGSGEWRSPYGIV